jgi:hypothetical protein
MIVEEEFAGLQRSEPFWSGPANARRVVPSVKAAETGEVRAYDLLDAKVIHET